MVDWGTLTAAAIGGLLAVVAGVISVLIARSRETDHWYRELQVRMAADALTALQSLVREITTIAYGEATPYQTLVATSPPATSTADRHVFPGDSAPRDFYSVVSKWNAALHRLLVSAPPTLIEITREIDLEVDRLLDLAIERRWSRKAFRDERLHIGHLMAQFVTETRRAIDLDPVDIDNVWTWANDDLASTPTE